MTPCLSIPAPLPAVCIAIILGLCLGCDTAGDGGAVTETSGSSGAGKTPAPPSSLPPDQVPGSDHTKPPGAERPPDGPEVLIDRIRAARTRRAVAHLAGLAIDAIEKMPHADRAAWWARLDDAVSTTWGGVDTLSNHPSPTEAKQCTVDFDDPDLLGGIPSAELASQMVVQTWNQPCGVVAIGNVQVEWTWYGHYHLSMEDPCIACMEGGEWFCPGPGAEECAVELASKPRYLSTHGGDEVIRIWVKSVLGQPMPFGVLQFTNLGPEVKFMYQKSTGEWFVWNSLAGATIWDVSEFVTDVLEVRITGAGGSGTVSVDWEAAFPDGSPTPLNFQVDDFLIEV